MYITRHATLRVRERLGIPKCAVERIVLKALSDGISYSETTGRLRSYLEWLYAQKQDANNIRIKDHYVYLFCEELLITVLHLPPEYRKAADKIARRKLHA